MEKMRNKWAVLAFLCGIFLVESASVLIQRYYFKYTRIRYGEGKRIFKCTPLHHHAICQQFPIAGELVRRREAISILKRKVITQDKIAP